MCEQHLEDIGVGRVAIKRCEDDVVAFNRPFHALIRKHMPGRQFAKVATAVAPKEAKRLVMMLSCEPLINDDNGDGSLDWVLEIARVATDKVTPYRFQQYVHVLSIAQMESTREHGYTYPYGYALA